MKNLTTLILLALLVAGIRVEAQNGPIIPCDLVDLAGQTLGRSPVIQRQRLQIDQANANFQQARSAFDFNLRAGLGVDYDRSDLFQADPRFALANSMIQSNNFRSFGGLQRTFRNGLLASVDLDYTRFANSFPLNDFNEEVGTYFPDNFTNVSLTLSQPLLRGRGRKFTAALERAAAIRVDGARSNLGFISAGEIRSVALSYWQYLTDYRRLNIFQQNEARVRKLLEITEELVKAEKKPAGDLVQIQADLVDKERQTVLARQQLYNSKQNLGRSIGLEEEESIRLGNPLNDFPELDQANYSAESELAQLLGLARTNRADLQFLSRNKEALEEGMKQVRNSLKPQLNLGGFVNYGGADPGRGADRFVTALGQREGRSMQVGFSLNYLFPLNNNLAQANYLAQNVAISDQQVVLDNQLRNIELNVSIAFNNLRNSVETLEKAKETLNFYEQVFDNEQIKFQNGMTTILNLILFQERLTFAQLDYLSSQQQFATAITNLRFETGTLYQRKDQSTESLDPVIFYQLPGTR